ncbi:MAG: CCA tRNA nucleotidyltransferase [Opitutales bacterium]
MPSLSKDDIPGALRTIGEAVSSAGGRAYKVGGCVRDAILGRDCKDFDLEVFGLDQEKWEQVLVSINRVEQVGKQFGVYKLSGLPIDVALPRRERKVDAGHRGFSTEPDPSMSLEAAAQRRDFTINAIYQDLLTEEMLDPVGGALDLKEKRLKHVSAAFSEDSLRVLRGMQFIARFDLTAVPETVELCRSIDGDDLPMERVGEEFYKLIVQGQEIGKGMRFLSEVGWLRYFPELKALQGCQQDPKWHPEGDVWVHTLHCLDVFAKERIGDSREDWVVGLAVLCHDLGKPDTTVFDQGRWKSPRHEYVGISVTERFLRRITQEKSLITSVLPLVECHMRPFQLFSGGARDAAVRRLANKVGRIDRLLRVCRADKQGRPPIVPEGFPELEALAERADQLQLADSGPQPLLQGRHLVAAGLEPSKQFKRILNAAFEAQLDGAFSDEAGAIEWFNNRSSDSKS